MTDPRDDQASRSSYFEVFSADDAEERFLADDAAFLRQILDEVHDDAAIDTYVATLGTSEAIGAALNWYRAMSTSNGAGASGGAAGGAAAGRSGYLEITVPTLYIYGGEDTAFSRRAAEASAAFVSGLYEFVVIERSGHWLMERAPGLVNEHLLDHLASGVSPYHLAFRQVRPGIWMGYRRDPYRSPVNGNVTIIVNDEDVVVVDAGSSPATARQIVAKIRSLSDAPVTTLINTHGHEDHVLGNQVFAEEFPGIEIVARPGTREYLESGGIQDRVENFLRETSSGQEAGAEEIDRVSRRGLTGDEVVAEHLRRYYDRDIYTVRDEYAQVRVTPPTRTFEGRLVLQRQRRTIELLDLGFGKAGSDVAVFLPQDRILIAGDIVTHPIPYGFSRLQTGWLETLARMERIDFDRIIPGHGDEPVDRAYLEQIIALVEFELSVVGAAVAAGRDAESTAWGARFARWAERFVGRDPVGLYFFDQWFVNPAVTRAHAELSGRAGRR